jgi:ketosteroid isomerase-like protein
MKTFSLPALCCLAFIALQCAPPPAPGVDTAAAAEALKKVDQDWSAEAGTHEGHVKYFTDDAVVLAPNEAAITGKENISKMLGEMHAIPGFKVSWKTQSAQVAASGEMGYSMGRYDFAMSDSTGSPVKDHGNYLTIWKKQDDGSWKVTVDMFNSELPAH